MSLRTIARSVEEQNNLTRRFQTASSVEPPADLDARKEVQEEIRLKVAVLGHTIDSLIEDGRDKSLALTALEDVLLRSGRAIFA